jgi:maltose alpha-D-glucosyltransferase/alpha-amylase
MDAPMAAGPLAGNAADDVPSLTVSAWNELFAGAARRPLECCVMPRFFQRQRWYAGKSRELSSVTLEDWCWWPEPGMSCAATVWSVRYGDGGEEGYFVPLAVSPAADAERWRTAIPTALAAHLQTPQGAGVLFDALADDGACTALLRLFEQPREWPWQRGVLHTVVTPALPELRGPADAPLRIARGAPHQSNSFVLFLPRLVLKVFRKLEPGIHPDFEMGRYLTEHTTFDRVPKVAGALEYRRAHGSPLLLGLLQQLVHNQGNGWDHALDNLRTYFARALPAGNPAAALHPLPGLLDLSPPAPPRAIAEWIGSYLESAATLGRRTAELHWALASSTDDPDFAPEPLTPADLSNWVDTARREAREPLAALARQADRLTETVSGMAQRLHGRRTQLVRQFDEALALHPQAVKTRCHGDYHLGQVLCSENDYVILDFEGEPGRPLAQRRAKLSPLKDVAGMLRSFDYAAQVGLQAATQDCPDDHHRLEPLARCWQRWTSLAFLRQYLATAAGAPFLPADSRDLRALLRFFLLEKALYELKYELHHRPEWVHVPLRGLLDLLGS